MRVIINAAEGASTAASPMKRRKVSSEKSDEKEGRGSWFVRESLLLSLDMYVKGRQQNYRIEN